jgi:hypothetical protein
MKIFGASPQYCVRTVEYSQTVWNSKILFNNITQTSAREDS